MLELRECNNRKAWDRICIENGSVFHLWDWVESVRDVYKADFKSLGIFENQELIGVFPLFSSKKIFNFLMSPLHGSCSAYGGPIFSSENNNSKNYVSALKLLTETPYFKKSQFIQIILNPPVEQEDFQAQSKLAYDLCEKTGNYDFSNAYTILMPVNKSPESLWPNLKKNCRTSIRKAQKSGIEVVETSSKNIFQDYFLMAKDTYAKSNLETGISKEMFTRICSVMENNKKLKILAAIYKNQIIACSLFLLHGQIVYYWDNVSYKQYSNLCANNLIQWAIIKWSAENGFSSYDLLGAGLFKVADFKLSFGGEIAPKLVLTKYRSHGARLAAGFYAKTLPVYRRCNYKLRRLGDPHSKSPDIQSFES